MMKTYIVNSKSHWRHLWSLILLGMTMPIVSHYMMLHKSNGYTTETAILVGSIFFVVFIGPILILHFNHYFESTNCTILYDNQTGQFIYNHREEEIKTSTEYIQNITVYKSWPMGQGRLPLFPWDVYNYAVIELKDGRILKISSLLVYELDKVVEFENTEIKKTLYAWMS